MSTVREAKKAWRRQFREALDRLAPTEVARESAAVVERILTEPRWRRARAVMLFIPFGNEIDILPLVERALAQEKALLIPRFNHATDSYQAVQVVEPGRELVRGPFGVQEPAASCPVFPLNQLDVTLVPGLGFDRAGRRLGRGKGHYDRLLADASGEFWGVGHDCQLVAELPGESHDVVLNCIATPAHWVEVVSARR